MGGPLSLGTPASVLPFFPSARPSSTLQKMAEFTAEQIEVPAEPAADTGFSADQLEDFKEAFGLFDRVGDNQVAFNQVADICRALGQNPTNKEVAAILGNPTAELSESKCSELEEELKTVTNNLKSL